MNYEKLKEAMKKRKVTNKQLAEHLNIDRSTLYRKLNMINGNDFTCSEMRSICLFLVISGDEFFE